MSNNKPPKVTVVKDNENVIELQIMEQAIIDVATAARKLLNSKLTNRAVFLLIKDSMKSPGLGLTDIEVVLNCAAKLDKRYLK